MRPGRRSRTAQYAAVVRAVLTHKGVVDDPHATRMLTASMRAAAALLTHLPSRVTDTAFYAGLATRTLAIDAELTRALDAGIRQVVIVGAGYDSRAWRFARNGVRFFEVDHPATQADKRRKAPPGGPTFASVDLAAEPLKDALDEVGVDWTAPVAFVLEGVTMYLEADQLAALFEAARENAAPRSRLIVNFAAPKGTGGNQDRRRQFVLATLGRAQGEGFRSARDIRDVERFVDAAGWAAVNVVTLRALARSLLPPGTALDRDEINPKASLVVAHVPERA